MLVNDRPAKVLILGEAQITHTQRWIAYFRDRGCTVRALSFPPIPARLSVESLGASSLPRALRILLAVPTLRRILAEFRPDITSALFLPDYGWLATLAGAHPLVVSAWGSDVLIAPHKSRWHRQRIVKIMRSADHLFGDANVLRDALINLGADGNRISIIPLGVDDRLLDIGAKRVISSHETTLVFHNRRLEPLYRPVTLINAGGRLAQRSPAQFRVIIAGGGSLQGELERQVDQLRLQDVVTFRGWMSPSELERQLTASDIYVSCSESDATSVSLLEAMATGCYPIVSDLPANREWVTDGVNGSLFPVGDDAALAERIAEVSSNAMGRDRARNANQEIIASRALWRNNMAAVEDVMIQVMNEAAKRK